MSKFFFVQLQNVEFLVEGGNPLGGAAVETFIWMKTLNEIGQEILQAKLVNDKRKELDGFEWIKTIPFYDEIEGDRMVWYRYRFPSMFRAIRNSKANFVYTSIPKWYSFYIGMMCKVLNVKHIVRVASDNMMDDRILENHTKTERFLISLGFKVADFIFVQNDYQYQSLVKKYSKSKVFKILNPIAIDRRYLKVKDQVKGYIAWVANFRDVKNLALLYKIAAELPQEEFRIAGLPLYPIEAETAESLPKLKSLANVSFVGQVQRNEILEFFAGAKFLLNTSKFEGFSNTFLEAMVTGTPILTTKNVNPDNIIDGYGLGYIYENESHLKDIFESLDLADYQVKSQNCVKYLRENHDNITLGKKILEIVDG